MSNAALTTLIPLPREEQSFSLAKLPPLMTTGWLFVLKCNAKMLLSAA